MGRGDLATLVRICDRAGRPRGTGFVADDRGTVVTSHEAVDGLVRIVLHASGERTCLAEADAITALPESGLALVRTEGLGVRPLPVSARTEVEAGMYVRIAAHGWREARVLGAATVTYTATDRFHVLRNAWELAIGTEGAEALRLGGQAAGGPVVDPATGAVLAVLGTALHGERPAAGYALPLAAVEPLAALLRRNAATVPCYGRELNLAGVLELTATSTGSAGAPKAWTEPVERADCAREFASFASGEALVLALVGVPGTGRTTALAAYCAERARGAAPAPTVWLRGADLRAEDASVADAVGRVLREAGRIVAASGARGDATTATPERAATLAREAGRPLLIVLDGPEEMPPALAHRLPAWTTGTETWLRTHGVRLLLGCRPEHWEVAGRLYAPESLHPRDPRTGPEGVGGSASMRGPDTAGAVVVGDLSEDESGLARGRYGLAPTHLAADDTRHPLALRLLAEVREALPGEVPGRPGRDEIFGAYLDLMSLRIAVRIAAGSRPLVRGTAVRRLAARVAGQVHEAARRCLGPGQGELDRESFEELFPWRTGWASAVLTEGLVVPAGPGYRFGHEELADWVQGAHLDVDGALHALVHRWHEGAPVRLPSRRGARPGAPGSGSGPGAPDPLPVPRHRIGPVVQALLLMGREQGPVALGLRLTGLAEALDRLSAAGLGATDAAWWGSRLLAQALQGLPDPRPYLPVLRRLADLIGARPSPQTTRPALPHHEAGPVPAQRAPEPQGPGPGTPPDASAAGPGFGTSPGALAPSFGPHAGAASPGFGAPAGGVPVQRAPEPHGPGPVTPPDAGAAGPGFGVPAGALVPSRVPRPCVPPEGAALTPFGPPFWVALRLTEGERLDLLRRLVPADAAPGGDAAPRYLDAVAARLVAEPRGVQPLLCRWFGDGRALAAAPYATVGTAAQALLHTHRDLAVDDLCEALVATAHPLAEGLLAVLVEDEPSAVCRAVDRWAHDDGRPARRAAAAAYGCLVAEHVTTDPDRELLRYTALALLARPGDAALHGDALGLLVRDPHTRARHLPRALGDPRVPASALATALPTHPEPVLAALQARLHGPGEAAGETLRALAEVTTPALARRAAALVREYVDRRPSDTAAAAHVAAFVDRRLEHGPAARAVLFPLVTGLLRGRPVQVRSALAPVLAAPGTGASRLLRTELLDVLLDHERYEARDLAVLDALLRAAALDCERRAEVRTRDLVHRTGLLLARTPEGATCLDRRLVELAREVPAFAAQLAGWLAAAPGEWSAVVAPGTRRTLRGLGSSMPMRAEGRGHGSLRPA
ncbi:trypsin-like peptidase domain-containing protein [Streptomyces vilmorinianum]|uniref:trypsin-like peptidase domain-containing protein n=1 Tax=Streptomyces vilmorinianum TaxID=3051092 RepID=UPI0010FAF63C|nr:trypsin-like peptidase domain-containing protein [Streptomyces vilmorinianum]